MHYLYHYYEKDVGPFISLSHLDIEEAEQILDQLRKRNKTFAAKRNDNYLERRKYLEQLVRSKFIEKGGHPIRQTPHYMVLEECPWLETWYENGRYIKIPIDKFNMSTVSFTYGDTFPTFSPQVKDGLEYREQVYTYDEIVELVKKYGLPQKTSQNNSEFARPRYIEVQVWSDKPIERYCDLSSIAKGIKNDETK